jgi:hypothetical protein
MIFWKTARFFKEGSPAYQVLFSDFQTPGTRPLPRREYKNRFNYAEIGVFVFRDCLIKGIFWSLKFSRNGELGIAVFKKPVYSMQANWLCRRGI